MDAGEAADAAGSAGAEVPSNSAACAQHGVFALRVIGVSDNGKGDDVSVPCVAGSLTRGVPPATWTLTVRAVDANGRFKELSDATPPDPGMLNPVVEGVVIGDGMSVPVDVQLIPQAECRDGIDNDRDGRVDLDDPDCAGDPNGPSEAAAP